MSKTITHRKTQKQYFIANYLIDGSDRDVDSSVMAGEKKDGYVRLFEDNSWTTEYFPIVKIPVNLFGFIVHGNPSDYWRNVIKEHPNLLKEQE